MSFIFMTPEGITYHSKTRELALRYADAEYRLSAEFLRVHSPSAEVRGHGKQIPTLVFGKKMVQINAIEPVGHYAVKLCFSDRHDSGIYTWDYLHELATQHEVYWQRYLERLSLEGQSRESRFIDIKELK